MTSLLQRAVGAGLLFVSLCAGAHTGGTNGYAAVTVAGRAVQYSLTLPWTSIPQNLRDATRAASPGAAPDPKPLVSALAGKIKVAADGRPCDAASAYAYVPASEQGNALLLIQFACPEAPNRITLRDDLFDALGLDHHTIAKFEAPGVNAQFAFQPDARETTVSLAAAGGTRGTGSFFLLGIQHVLAGWDHLLFLLALILRGGKLWSLVKILTAFTVAHSTTLALSALDWVRLPERLVESVIALSIAWVAAENLLNKSALSHRWMVSFGFGLVHGFGFANVLRELGLPATGLAWALLGFNLGVEAGQLLAVALVVPLLVRLRRFSWEPRAITGASALVLVTGLAVFAERLLA